MEVRLPIRVTGENETRWPVIRYDRTDAGNEIVKTVRVKDCPLRIIIEPWSEEKIVTRWETQLGNVPKPEVSNYQRYSRFIFDQGQSNSLVTLRLNASRFNDEHRAKKGSPLGPGSHTIPVGFDPVKVASSFLSSVMPIDRRTRISLVVNKERS